jgi:hypothetical protein
MSSNGCITTHYSLGQLAYGRAVAEDAAGVLLREMLCCCWRCWRAVAEDAAGVLLRELVSGWRALGRAVALAAAPWRGPRWALPGEGC